MLYYPVLTVREAEIAQKLLITALESAEFPLRKLISSTQELLDNLPKDHILNTALLILPESENDKSLGIRWNPKEDNFSFRASKQRENQSTLSVQFYLLSLNSLSHMVC